MGKITDLLIQYKAGESDKIFDEQKKYLEDLKKQTRNHLFINFDDLHTENPGQKR